MKIFAADDPLVLNGTYDQEGYKPGERARIANAAARRLAEQARCDHRFNTDGFCPKCSATRPSPQEEADPMAKRKNETRRQTGRAAPAKPPARRPRQAPLGGMEDVRIRALDECAASIAEIRDQMNELRSQEGDYLKNALKLMRKHERTSWRAAGVELVRVPGEEKLRVRTSKEKATAEVEEEEAADEQVEHVEVVDGAGEELRPGVQAEH